MRLTVAVLLLFGCTPNRRDQPPPIRHGSCAVTYFEGGVAERQRCAWDGASWDCVGKICTRGQALPIEARMVAR